MADWTWTDDEVAAQASIARAAAEADQEPRAVAARYDRDSGQFVISLASGATFMFPAALAQGLSDADPDLLVQVEVSPEGYGLHWEVLDIDFSMSGLVQGRFGNKAWMSQLRRTPASPVGQGIAETGTPSPKGPGARSARQRKSGRG